MSCCLQGADLLGEPGGHLHVGEQAAGRLTNLFSQNKRRRRPILSTRYVENKTLRSIWRWMCQWDRVSDLCEGGHLHEDEQPAREAYQLSHEKEGKIH